MNTKPFKKSDGGKMLRGKSVIIVVLASIMIPVCMTASVAAQPAPFMISGYVFCEDGSECNNPCVNITNLDTNGKWVAETNASSNYYQLILAMSVNINASEKLRFNATSSDGNQSEVFDHIVSETEVDKGGLFNFNITLESSPLWDPWIYDTRPPYGEIDKSEAIDAVQDYFDDIITKEQALDVIQLYFG